MKKLLMLLSVFFFIGESQGLDIFSSRKNPDVPPGMVFVPEGKFVMGISRDKIYLDPEVGIGVNSFPERTIFLKSFFIDKYETSIKEFREFVVATGNKPPTIWMWNPTYPRPQDNHPVIGLTWFDADAYCHFKGKRLPTEAEWEKAARGADGRIYPWGDKFDYEKCNILESDKKYTTPIDSFPEGKSPYGLYNMCGNVMEWTSSPYKPYMAPKTGEEKEKVLRGGAWETPLKPSATTFGRAFNSPEWGFSSYGVRCVKDVEK